MQFEISKSHHNFKKFTLFFITSAKYCFSYQFSINTYTRPNGLNFKLRKIYEDIPYHGTEMYLTRKDGECRTAFDG